MHSSTLIAGVTAALTLVTPSLAGYSLEDDYNASNFFSMFSFFTSADPTHGFVQYVDQGTAQSQGLISSNSSSVYMGVDHTNVAPNGRSSVRLTSNKVYNHGLIVLDLAHMPEGCGTWPAFWTVGPNWPNSGEIDIIEGVNSQLSNAMTLHTGPNCGITKSNPFSGSIQTSSCDVNAPGQSANAGCSIDAANGNTYGTGLNAIGGGVFATEWTSEAISIFFFPRGSIPSDISAGTPNPSGWGIPLAVFAGACTLDSNVMNQQIVFDTTFCGDWAGNVWGSSGCAARASSCNAFVQNNPSAFQDAYWSVNSLKVYQDNGNNAPIVSSKTTLAPATTATRSLAGIGTSLPATISSLAPIPGNPFEVSIIEPGQTQVAHAEGTSSVSIPSVSAVPTPTAAPTLPPTTSDTPGGFEVQSIGVAGDIPGGQVQHEQGSATASANPAPTPAPIPAQTPGNTETVQDGTGEEAVEVQSIAQRGVPVIATTLLTATRGHAVAPVIATSMPSAKMQKSKRAHPRHLPVHARRAHRLHNNPGLGLGFNA